MRVWRVEVEGFPPYLVVSPTRASARAKVWRQYCDVWGRTEFLAFLRGVRVTVLAEAEGRTDDAS